MTSQGLTMIALCATVALASAWVAYREALPYVRSGPTIEARFQAFAQDQVWPGLSFNSERLVLKDCVDLIDSFFARVQSDGERKKVEDHCEALATSALADTATDSLAWITLASIAGSRKRVSEMNSALANAARFGLWDGELLITRAKLSERYLPDLTEQVAQEHMMDLRRLLSFPTGVDFLARRYLGEADFRIRLETVLQASFPKELERFVAAVERFQLTSVVDRSPVR